MKSYDEENDRIILNLKAEIRKQKEFEPSSEINRSSVVASFSRQSNLKKQLKLTSDFGMFNARISNIRNTITKIVKQQSFYNDEEIKEIDEEVEKPENPEKSEKSEKSEKKSPRSKLLIEKNKPVTAPIEYKYLVFDEARFFLLKN